MYHLPEEILPPIISHLQPTLPEPHWLPCSKDNRIIYNTLAPLSRVNKACHRLATPLFYRTVEVYQPLTVHHRDDYQGMPLGFE